MEQRLHWNDKELLEMLEKVFEKKIAMPVIPPKVEPKKKKSLKQKLSSRKKISKDVSEPVISKKHTEEVLPEPEAIVEDDSEPEEDVPKKVRQKYIVDMSEKPQDPGVPNEILLKQAMDA